MPWADLCARGGLTTGTEVQLSQLSGHSADAALLAAAGLPTAANLARFLNKVQGLKLKETYSGISFNIVSAWVRGNDVLTTELFKEVQKIKDGSAVCYEDAVFFKKLYSTPADGTTILVHQSLAPCERCRGGYKQWAKNLGSTIVISADKGYDGSSGNPIFVFSGTGAVYYIK